MTDRMYAFSDDPVLDRIFNEDMDKYLTDEMRAEKNIVKRYEMFIDALRASDDIKVQELGNRMDREIGQRIEDKHGTQIEDEE